ncbi:MAG: TonB-dependent receptor [Bacteroidota bacterium]
MKYAWLWLCGITGLGIQGLYAQSTPADSSFWLSGVDIQAERTRHFSLGNSQARLDSQLVRFGQGLNLGQALAIDSRFFVKDYGPGGLVSLSSRGTSASHTAVLWKGIPLQSLTLGQADLSLYQAGNAEEVDLQYGSAVNLAGSGAIGGVISLVDKRPVPGRWKLGGGVHLDQNGQEHLSLKAEAANKRIYARVRGGHRQADNDYWFWRPRGFGPREKIQQEHAAFFQQQFQADLGTLLPDGQQWEISTWQQSARRQLINSRAGQQDQASRCALRWQMPKPGWRPRVLLALWKDQLAYQDSLIGLNSESQTVNHLMEAESQHSLKGWTFLMGYRWHRQQAQVSAYGPEPLFRVEQAGLLSALWESPQSRLAWRSSLRKAFLDGAALPWIPETGLEAKLSRLLSLRAKIARSYRIPTFNDLYWQPGGNPDLLPETGWNQEVGLTGKLPPIHMKWEAGLFNSQIDNWILWLPGPQYWAPENVLKVWSRGWEFQGSWERQLGSWHSLAKIQYQYARTTREATTVPGDAGLFRQLIYVPRHQANALLRLQKNRWQAQTSLQYVGRRFTATDHSSHLDPYLVGQASLGYSMPLKSGQLFWQLQVQNFFNTDYQVVAGRPMPLRYFSVNIHFQLQNLK